jgi:hypothetical protein
LAVNTGAIAAAAAAAEARVRLVAARDVRTFSFITKSLLARRIYMTRLSITHRITCSSSSRSSLLCTDEEGAEKKGWKENKKKQKTV